MSRFASRRRLERVTFAAFVVAAVAVLIAGRMWAVERERRKEREVCAAIVRLYAPKIGLGPRALDDLAAEVERGK